MFRDIINTMFYVEENGIRRLSMTKLGAAIKSFGIYIGGSLSGLTIFAVDQKLGVTLAVISAIIGGIGNFFEDVGKRDAMK